MSVDPTIVAGLVAGLLVVSVFMAIPLVGVDAHVAYTEGHQDCMLAEGTLEAAYQNRHRGLNRVMYDWGFRRGDRVARTQVKLEARKKANREKFFR